MRRHPRNRVLQARIASKIRELAPRVFSRVVDLFEYDGAAPSEISRCCSRAGEQHSNSRRMSNSPAGLRLASAYKIYARAYVLAYDRVLILTFCPLPPSFSPAPLPLSVGHSSFSRDQKEDTVMKKQDVAVAVVKINFFPPPPLLPLPSYTTMFSSLVLSLSLSRHNARVFDCTSGVYARGTENAREKTGLSENMIV